MTRLLFFACLIVTFDMYDLVIFGSVVPSLMADWQMSPSVAGLVGSAGVVGMMFGAMGFGVLADRFGRRRILLLAVAMFSVATLLCAAAPSPAVFALLRFFAGLGIGGILPSISAMITEASPSHLRNRFIAIIMCFFSVGGILAALVAMAVLPHLSWRVVYLVAAIPLLLLPAMAQAFPASVPPREGPAAAAPVIELFRGGRGTATVLVWVAFFMCLLMVNGLNTWLPQLMVTAGYQLSAGLTFMAVMNVGAIVGTLVMGTLSDRYGIKRTLVPMFLGAAITLLLLGMHWPYAALLAVVFLAGAGTMGAQNLSYGFVTQYYPARIGATAVGMASGVGRLGAILGPTFGGLLLAWGVSAQLNFLFFALPGVIAAAAFLAVPRRGSDMLGRTA